MHGIYLKLLKKPITSTAEDIMTPELQKEGYEINDDPKVVVLPDIGQDTRFELPSFEPPHRIQVSGINISPSIEQPKTISLDVSDDMTLQIWRDDLSLQSDSTVSVNSYPKMEVDLIRKTDQTHIQPDYRDDLIDFLDDYDPIDEITATEMRVRRPNTR